MLKTACFVSRSFYNEFVCVSSSTWKRLFTSNSLQNDALDKSVLDQFAKVVGPKNVATSEAACLHHSHDESYHRNKSPLAVVWPNSVDEVSKVAKICNQQTIAMIPYGTGTGLEGGVSPVTRSVSVNLTNMNQILEINVEDLNVKVQPGVTRTQLNKELRSTGLWFPVDPGADASICGMAATGASGTNAVRYGTMKENVLNLEVVLANGSILHTGGKKRKCRKTSAGYNLTELFVGSEGTLGFITEATVKLHPVPECVISAICSFPSIPDAVNSVMQVMQSCIPIARIELLDSNTMDSINKFSKTNYPVLPTLFLEFHGSESSTKEQVEGTSEIAAENGGSEFLWARTQEERNKLWKARHDVLYALMANFPGKSPYSTDVCVPVSQLPEAVDHAITMLEKESIPVSIVGHVGDGNFHCFIPTDTSSRQNIEKTKMIGESIGRKAIELGGSCTGEHGIGLGKQDLLAAEIGEDGINVMKAIKFSIDPFHLMNPGKVLP